MFMLGGMVVLWSAKKKRKKKEENFGENFMSLPSILFFNIEDNVDFEFGGEVFDFHPLALFHIFYFKRKREKNQEKKIK